VVLGALLGEAATNGRDKLTLLADPPVAAAGWWLEQLIAESSGKDGKGIIVIEEEEAASADHYGRDRLFIHLKTSGEKDELVAALRKANHPVVTFEIHDIPSMLAEFFRWEIATATACHILGVNAFDQPDVLDNKERTRQILDAFGQEKQFPEPTGGKQVDGMTLYSAMELPIDSLRSLLDGFLSLAVEGDAIAINAYLPRNSETKATLARLRHEIWMRTGCATSLNFGPRFLHSTGQLHKGGPNTILFLQITAERQEEIEIPGEPYGFRILEQAQALGDFQALQARGRRILRVHLPSMDNLNKLTLAMSGTNG
jgi:transaldolase/glucose-6-phosphate isomerase